MKVRADEEYEFGSYRLNVNECKLWHGTDEIKLRPKLFSLLVIFIKHQGRMQTGVSLCSRSPGPPRSDIPTTCIRGRRPDRATGRSVTAPLRPLYFQIE